MFHALGLAPISQVFYGGNIPIPLDTRRVVLLVPKPGLRLLRSFKSSEIYLALSGKVQPFDNHFTGVHTAFVKVLRGSGRAQDGHAGWRCLTRHLAVRDTREDDPEAELMVSALVPTFALLMAPPDLTELQLRPRDSGETMTAPKDLLKKLGGQFSKVFYKADLSNIESTAILIPGATGSIYQGGASRPRFACPEKVVTARSVNETPRPRAGRDPSGQSVIHYRFVVGGADVDQSIELIDQAGGRGTSQLVYRVTLNMGSAKARFSLAEGGAPVFEKTLDPCTVRVKLWEGARHVISFPFPVKRSSVVMKYSKLQGFVGFTVHPLSSARSQPTIAWTAHDAEGVGLSVLPSMLSWSPCPPLSSLPRLDFKAEWAHEKVRDIESGAVA